MLVVLGASVMSSVPSSASRDLEDHADEALPDLDAGAMDGGAAVGVNLHARRAVVVEALREADVLEADREADAALDAFAPGRVARAAREPDRVARQRLGLGHGNRGGGADDLGNGQRAGQDLSGRERVAALDRVQQAQLDRVDAERLGQHVHLRLGREAHLHGAEAAHRAARRIVRVDRRALDQGVVDAVRADREGRGVRDHRGRARGIGATVDQDPHVRRRRRGRRGVARCSAQILAGCRWTWPVNDSSRL